MKFYNLKENDEQVSFSGAVKQGLGRNQGLFFPESIPSFNDIEQLLALPLVERSVKVLHPFVSEDLTEEQLTEIVTEAFNFPAQIQPISEKRAILELFHGPTMAFKDVGARFMARCLGYFNKNNKNQVTVLVATSGDTGGAVANGFLGVKGVNVVILYPSGKVSDIQEKQLTTLGQNITALEVDGVFDDCQDMVKRAFLDEELTSIMQLTSANSINVARWLPQMFYFMFAYKQLKHKYKNIVFSVPSGNFGNVCAGMMAQQLGLPIKHFVASNNENNVVTEYLKTEHYDPKPSVQTISNAMDVGNPSNFVRIQEIYKNDFNLLQNNLSSFSFSDAETKKAMLEIYNEYGYVADPHGAVGYLGAKAFLKTNPESHCVFLETAHSTKFLDVVEAVIKTKVELPEQIQSVMNKEKSSIRVKDYDDLKVFLKSNH